MAAKNWSNILSLLAILQVFLVLTKADDAEVSIDYAPVQVNVSTNLDVYKSQNERQLSAQLEGMKSQLDAFQENFERQLETVSSNCDLVESQIKECDQKIYSLALLNDVNNFCVQKYCGELVTVATVRSTVSSCINEASASLGSILHDALKTYTNLYNFFNSGWEAGLNECARVNNASYDSQVLCVTNFVQGSIDYFNTNLREFTSQLDGARCASNTRVRLATKCVFNISNSALSSVGQVKRLVNDCVAGIGICPTCAPVETTPAPAQPECQRIDIHADMVTNANETIANPFKGLGPNQCVLVNLI